MSPNFSIGVLGMAGLGDRVVWLLGGGARFGVEVPDFLAFFFLPRLRFFFGEVSLFAVLSTSSLLSSLSSSSSFGGRSDFMQSTSDWRLIPSCRRVFRSSVRVFPL